MSAVDYELCGWIQPCDPDATEEEARQELEDLRINVGEWDSVIKEFKNCIVSREALGALDPLWGRYIWGLQ